MMMMMSLHLWCCLWWEWCWYRRWWTQSPHWCWCWSQWLCSSAVPHQEPMEETRWTPVHHQILTLMTDQLALRRVLSNTGFIKLITRVLSLLVTNHKCRVAWYFLAVQMFYMLYLCCCSLEEPVLTIEMISKHFQQQSHVLGNYWQQWLTRLFLQYLHYKWTQPLLPVVLVMGSEVEHH